MDSKTSIGNANGIGFKRKSTRGDTPPPVDIFDALLLEQGGAILLENGNYIKLETVPINVKHIKYKDYGNTRK